MEVLVLNAEVSRLEAELAEAVHDDDRWPLLVALSWHLRQRDTRRALQLAEEAAALPAARSADAHAALLRLDLVRGEAAWLFGRLDEAHAIAQRTLSAFTALADDIGCSDTHWLLASIANDYGDSGQRNVQHELATVCARRAGDTLRADIAEAALARWAVLRNPHEAEQRWGQRFNIDPDELHPALAAWAIDYLSMVAFQASDFGKAVAYRVKLHDYALQTGQVQRAIIALTNIGGCLANLNDFHSALEWMNMGLEMARPTGWPACVGIGMVQTAEILRQLGRTLAAHDLLLEALDTLEPLARSRTYSIALEYLGNIAIDRADYAGALDIFRRHDAHAGALGEFTSQIIARRGQAQALLHLGRAAEANAAALASLASAQEQRDAYNEIAALRALADIHSRHPLPAPAGMTAANAALHYLHQALDVAARIDGYIVPGHLYDATGQAYAEAGDTATAYAMSLKAIAAREKTNSADALNRSVAMQIRMQTERVRAEAEHHRQLAESEARRAETLQQMSITLERLSAIGQEITAHLDVATIFETLNRHVHGLLDVSNFTVFLFTPDRTHLECVYGIEQGKPLPKLCLPLSHPTSNIVRAVREGIEIARDDLPPGHNPNQIPGTFLARSALFAPLQSGSRVLGAMTVQSPHAYAYTERERLIFRTLCAYGAIALDNASTYRQMESLLKALKETQAQLVEKNLELERAYKEQQQMTLTDPLTGLRNRRFLLQHIDKEIALTLRRNRRRLQRETAAEVRDTDLVFFMIDVDHFKSVNDTHGHAAGDLVLVQMKERLLAATRETDYVVRWGGEEFLVVARATNRDEASVIAERIRSAVASQPFLLEHGEQICRTCSIGFASFLSCRERPQALSWSQTVELADQALYLAKQNGRDAWVGLYPTERTHADSLLREVLRNAEQAILNDEVRLVASRQIGFLDPLTANL